MKSARSILVAAFLITSFFVTAPAAPNADFGSSSVDRLEAITLDEARKIALKKVAGTIEDEFSLEDEEGKVTSYIFVIKDAKGKFWEVEIGAEKGEILSVEKQEDYNEDVADPPSDEDAPEPPLVGKSI